MDMAKLKEAMAAKKEKKADPSEIVIIDEEKQPELVAKTIVEAANSVEVTQGPLKPLSGAVEPVVFEFIRNIKETKLRIPIVGASNSELFLAFPDINPNTLRFTVWSLRKKGYLEDSDIRRKPPKGTATPQVVWIATRSLEAV